MLDIREDPDSHSYITHFTDKMGDKIASES